MWNIQLVGFRITGWVDDYSNHVLLIHLCSSNKIPAKIRGVFRTLSNIYYGALSVISQFLKKYIIDMVLNATLKPQIGSWRGLMRLAFHHSPFELILVLKMKQLKLFIFGWPNLRRPVWHITKNCGLISEKDIQTQLYLISAQWYILYTNQSYNLPGKLNSWFLYEM